jgi:hypothetical protein
METQTSHTKLSTLMETNYMKKSNTTTHRELALDIVKELHKEIPAKFKKVNNGGCAYFARFFYEEFTKLKTEVEIEIKGLRSFWGGYQHIFLVIEGKPFDAGGYIDEEIEKFGPKYGIDHLDHEKLLDITNIDDRENWNPEFGINDRKNLGKELKDYFDNKRRTLKIK